MNKTEQLLHMMEHPHEYTDGEWQQMLHDEECRELYTMMSKTRSAIDAARTDELITDETIESEWQKLCEETKAKRERFMLKYAAMFIGLLLMSGIALAAIHFAGERNSMNGHQAEVKSKDSATEVLPTSKTASQSADVSLSEYVTFDNVTLEKILTEIAEHHHAETVFENEEARRLRFHFVWYREQSLGKVVESLNHFEHVDILINDNKLIVR